MDLPHVGEEVGRPHPPPRPRRAPGRDALADRGQAPDRRGQLGDRRMARASSVAPPDPRGGRARCLGSEGPARPDGRLRDLGPGSLPQPAHLLGARLQGHGRRRADLGVHPGLQRLPHRLRQRGPAAVRAAVGPALLGRRGQHRRASALPRQGPPRGLLPVQAVQDRPAAPAGPPLGAAVLRRAGDRHVPQLPCRVPGVRRGGLQEHAQHQGGPFRLRQAQAPCRTSATPRPSPT